MVYFFDDFDGVYNVCASKTQFVRSRKAGIVPGYARRATASTMGFAYPLLYSDELIFRLNTLKEKVNFTWLHLTTWEEDSCTILDPLLGMRGDGYVPWDPYFNITQVNLVSERASRKYAALKETAGDEPFVWVDDEATVMFNPADFPRTPECLIVATDPQFGVTQVQLQEILDFLERHSQ